MITNQGWGGEMEMNKIIITLNNIISLSPPHISKCKVDFPFDESFPPVWV